MQSQYQTHSPKSSQLLIFRLLDYLVRMAFIPVTYLLSTSISLFQLFCKIARLVLTFVMTGIQGVLRALRMGAFGEKIHYAVLKENGQYLKLRDRTLEQVFTCQLYDYGIRKFMSISELQQDAKVTQIQFWSTVGLNFIKQKFKLKNVSALTNSQQKINRFRNKLKQIDLWCTDYSNEAQAHAPYTTQQPNFQHQDIFIFFNRSKDQHQQQEHKIQIDMIKVLSYIKRNLSENGYAVFGNYFTCEGQISVFQEILDGFGFKIQMKEDITPNIIHSKRVLARIHKNRKIAWLAGKIRQFLQHAYEHDNIISSSVRSIWKILQQLAGLKTNQCKYNLYILQHAL